METLIPVRSGHADFSDLRALETSHDYPRVATECEAHAILLLGSLAETNLDDPTGPPVHTVHAALIYPSGQVAMSGTQYCGREDREGVPTLVWSEPHLESGPFGAKGPGWAAPAVN